MTSDILITQDEVKAPPAAQSAAERRGGEQEIAFQSCGVELHPKLPPLPAEIFHVMRERVAKLIRAAARQENLDLPDAACTAQANLVLAFFHWCGLGGKLYAREEATIQFLDCTVGWTPRSGMAATAAMEAVLANPAGPLEFRLARLSLSPEVHRAVRAPVLAAMHAIAARKNVPPDVAKIDARADGVVDFAHVFGLAGKLMTGDCRTIALMERAADHGLDRDMAARAALVSALAREPRGDRLDWEVLALWADEALKRLRARHPEGSFYRWPDIGGGMPVAFAAFGILSAEVHGGRS